MTPRALPMGERAVLFEVDALDDVLALRDALAASPVDGVLDVVPAARTVLVHFDPRVVSAATIRAWVLAADPTAARRRDAREVEVEVVYDGPDLAETADLLGVSPEALVRRHADADWVVAFTGFAPGFAYLVSDDWPFDVPRLATPRTRVPAGAVGLAGGFSGAYPRETPGGWRLIGTTRARLFDPDAAAPALLAPAARVRFVPVPAHAPAAAHAATGEHPPATAHKPIPAPASATANAIVVVEAGPLATVQDLGRGGAASLGVPRSGAADRAALRLANRLVGNAEDAAAIEITVGGFAAVAERPTWFAVTGAWGDVTVDGRVVDPYAAHEWPAGADVRVAPFAHGLRGLLAVRGGIDAPLVLGSRSSDVLSGLGPVRLAPGARLALGAVTGDVPIVDVAPWSEPHDDDLELDAAPGPRGDWFAASALEHFFTATWIVSAAADRVGVRLDGPVLTRVREGELASEGMVPGAVQVPPDGRPVVLGADAPATGGYPVIAVLTDAALDLLAQARPGARVRFRHARAGM